MKVIEMGDAKWQDGAKELFDGQTYTRPVLGEETSRLLRASIVTFSPGARTKDHIHDTMDQVLYVTDGLGILASAGQQRMVGPGTFIYIPAGENHWHGAARNMSFTHISFLAPPGKTTIVTSSVSETAK